MFLFQFTLFGNNGFDPTMIGTQEIFGLIFRVMQFALGLIGAIAVVYIIIAGIQYITAGGVDAKQAEAKKTIEAAIVGLIIVVLSFTLVSTLLRTLGFNDTIEKQNPNIRDVIH
jgi:small-conductance mechanosensitive channel